MNTKKILLTLLLCIAASAQATTKEANAKSEASLTNTSLQDVSPYINVGTSQDFGTQTKTGMGIDAFIPIVGTDTQLFFSNVQVNSYSNKTFEGGLYLGYRNLLPEEQKLYGVYTGLDFKKTEDGNYFKQITLGAEYWIKQWFFGYKIFSPIGNSENSYERAVPGISAEIGYEFSKKSSIFVEGYYLNTFDTSNAPGVKVRFKQTLFSKETNSGVLDQVNLEVGVQKDKLTGTRFFVELNFKLGGSSSSTPDGVAKHMTDTISKSKIFTEARATITTIENKTRTIECYYWKDSGDLATDGSSKSCPASYSDISKNSNMTLIDEIEDRAFNGVTLNMRY